MERVRKKGQSHDINTYHIQCHDQPTAPPHPPSPIQQTKLYPRRHGLIRLRIIADDQRLPLSLEPNPNLTADGPRLGAVNEQSTQDVVVWRGELMVDDVGAAVLAVVAVDGVSCLGLIGGNGKGRGRICMASFSCIGWEGLGGNATNRNHRHSYTEPFRRFGYGSLPLVSRRSRCIRHLLDACMPRSGYIERRKSDFASSLNFTTGNVPQSVTFILDRGVEFQLATVTAALMFWHRFVPFLSLSLRVFLFVT